MKVVSVFLVSVACLSEPILLEAQDLNSVPTSISRGGDFDITMAGILNVLANHPQDTTAEKMVVRLIERYGVGFRPSALDFENLRKAFASDSLLDAVRLARLPPIPEVHEGTLAVQCLPVDCEVLINGELRGRTRSGQTLLMQLSEGAAHVAARNVGYDAANSGEEVQILKDGLVQLRFDLRRSKATLIEAGMAMRKNMVDALRHTNSVVGSPSNSVRILGVVYCSDLNHHLAILPVNGWLTDSRVLELKETVERGQKWASGTVDKQDLERILDRLLNGQLEALLPHLLSASASVIADDESFTRGLQVFRVEEGDQVYRVTLDAINRPSEIEVSSLSSGTNVRFLYSDYLDIGYSRFPRSTQVLSRVSDQGVELQVNFLHAQQPQTKEKKLTHVAKSFAASERRDK